MKKVIFIDRDGVINWDPIGDYIKKWEDFRFLDNVMAAMKKLTEAEYDIVIVSNQAGIGDGKYLKKDLDEITKNMMRAFKDNGANVVAGYYCLHGKKAGCSCRKPETGLFELAAKDFTFDKQTTYFIGDKLSDIEAGKRFGLKTVLVLTGHGTNEEKNITDALRPDYIMDDLMGAVSIVLAEQAVC